jgi:hypothetical protein
MPKGLSGQFTSVLRKKLEMAPKNVKPITGTGLSSHRRLNELSPHTLAFIHPVGAVIPFHQSMPTKKALPPCSEKRLLVGWRF